jgi:archaetidylinositol phosphate synthase
LRTRAEGGGIDKSTMDDVARNQTYAHALARVFVRPLIGTWVRPNHLTILRLIVGLSACALLAVGIRTAAVWSGILWIVTCMLDRADGELARLGDLRSESGKVLDYYSDMILDALWFLSAGLGLRHGWLGDVAVPLGLLTSASMLLCIRYAEMFERLSGPGTKAWSGVQRFHPDDALFLLAPLTWLGWLTPILIASSVCTPIIAIVFIARYMSLKRRTTAA